MNTFNLLDRYLPLITQPARYKVIYGGRGGGKSWSVAYSILQLGILNPLRILCLREYQNSMADSVHQLLSDLIMRYEPLANAYTIYNNYIESSNGTIITFSGIYNAKNIKSFEGADIAWVEEASYISAKSMQILLPTIRKENSEIWFTFNPDHKNDPVYSFILNPRPNQITINVNYTDNPYCSKEIIDEANYCKDNNPHDYNHIWLGECANVSDAVIFKDKWEIQEFMLIDLNKMGQPLFGNEFIKLRHGLDFGWVHPTAIIQAFKYNNCIYIYNEIGGKEMTLNDITTRFTTEFEFVNSNTLIYGDSARPDSIEQLRASRYGDDGQHIPSLNVRSANKNKGSVESGITWLKSHNKIYIHPRCKQTIMNFESYSYKQDNDGNITTQIINIKDDYIAAIRYAFSDEIANGDNSFASIDWVAVAEQLVNDRPYNNTYPYYRSW
jgi:phage terminase large subunit